MSGGKESLFHNKKDPLPPFVFFFFDFSFTSTKKIEDRLKIFDITLNVRKIFF